ncbi:hypothetical protein L5515_012152 [Caenorhabditis briggsae]|uniref:Uncharacterized protein n=1 Tax=Caenorhabditis briggsae TaxID=6238 RepID=A0AAE9JGN9_CAEBR|nr:hypothetical protein L5515_012152 [Caenorhabditis briggsae]
MGAYKCTHKEGYISSRVVAPPYPLYVLQTMAFYEKPDDGDGFLGLSIEIRIQLNFSLPPFQFFNNTTQTEE